MIRLVAWPLIGLLILGCGSEPNNEISGTYRLVGVDASPLPYLETSDADCDQFISEGELDLVAGGSYDLEFWDPAIVPGARGSPVRWGGSTTGPSLRPASTRCRSRRRYPASAPCTSTAPPIRWRRL